MNTWTEFQNASPAALSEAQLAEGYVASLVDLGVIAVAGEDAARFLHGQLTNDVEHLGLHEVRLAGYCTAKGRLQATFVMWRSADAVYLQLPLELQAALQKRLSMFVLRAKAKLSDATPEITLGFGGVAAEAALQDVFGALPLQPWTRIDHDTGPLLRVADAFGAPRYQWLTTCAAAEAAWPSLAGLTPAPLAAWHRAAIHAGVPQITARTQEQFVPQMVNLELLGGVNFKKGCYPGQEIVARSQYLGKLKRRTALAHIAGAAQAGDEVFALADPDQPCGMVVNAAPDGAGGTDALVEMKLAALDGEVRLGSATGAPLAFRPLPYELDALEV
jgi:folate-binding protein YgfZ